MTFFNTIFSVIFLTITNIFFVNQAMSASNPSYTSQALHKEADKHEYLAKHHEYLSHYDGMETSRPLRKAYADELSAQASKTRQKAQKVEKVERQLKTNTVAGNSSPPRARTRSQAKHVTL